MIIIIFTLYTFMHKLHSRQLRDGAVCKHIYWCSWYLHWCQAFHHIFSSLLFSALFFASSLLSPLLSSLLLLYVLFSFSYPQYYFLPLSFVLRIVLCVNLSIPLFFLLHTILQKSQINFKQSSIPPFHTHTIFILYAII